MSTKTCTKCGLDKQVNAENFYRQKSSKDGFRPDCKCCRNKVNKKWMSKPVVSERRRQYSKEWRELNREKHLKNCSDWARNNRDRANQNAKRNYHEKYKHDPSFRTRRAVSSAIHRSLNNSVENSVWDYLPYSLEQLSEHLESQFDQHMTWDNYGSYWHIDHIYPQSLLPYDSLDHENFLLVWDLNNLQPLSAIENMSKGNEIPEIIPEHIKNFLES